MADKTQFKVVTNDFRGSFVNLVRARERDSEDGTTRKEYDICVVLPKDTVFDNKAPVKRRGKPFWQTLKAMEKKIASEEWGEGVGFASKIKDGDDDKDGERTLRPEWAGCMTLVVNNTRKPGIIRSDGSAVEELTDDEIYSGRWYRVAMRPFTYAPRNKQKKILRRGVSWSLDNVMLIPAGDRDDSPFDGRTDASEDFAGYEEDAGDGFDEEVEESSLLD